CARATKRRCEVLVEPAVRIAPAPMKIKVKAPTNSATPFRHAAILTSRLPRRRSGAAYLYYSTRPGPRFIGYTRPNRDRIQGRTRGPAEMAATRRPGRQGSGRTVRYRPRSACRDGRLRIASRGPYGPSPGTPARLRCRPTAGTR